MDLLRRARSSVEPSTSTSTSTTVPAPTPPSSRMTIFPSIKLPALRRRPSSEQNNHQKTPLLTLKLSDPSFLQTSLKDDDSAEPLYRIKTSRASTTVSRRDPKESSVTTAQIKWPKILPARVKGKVYSDGVLIQMKGARWYGGETLLKHGSSLAAPRRFSIPNYAQPMRWQKYGSSYWCITASVKGPVATLDMSNGSEPAKLTFYETLRDKYDPKSLSSFKGISLLLADYVLITALLLVTDLQEWMTLRKSEDRMTITDTIGGSSTIQSFYSGPENTKPTWRTPSVEKPQETRLPIAEMFQATSRPNNLGGTEAPNSLGFEHLASESTSSTVSSRRESTITKVDEDDQEYDEGDADSELLLEDVLNFESAPTRSMCAGSEFISPALTYGYFTSDDRDSSPPPVPPLPVQYSTSLNKSTVSQPSTPESGRTRPLRSLPPPPTTRPRSTPPAASISQFLREDPSQPKRSDNQNQISGVSSSAPVTRRDSVSRRRPLPRPPVMNTAGTGSSNSTIRRAKSSGRLGDSASSSERSTTPKPPVPQRSLPLPSTPPTSPETTTSISSTPEPESSHSNYTLIPSQIPLDSTPAPSHPDPTQPDTLDPNHIYARKPPITKVSQEELAKWVHLLTVPQRDLPPAPLPESSIFDVPPPAYSTIYYPRDSVDAGSGGREAPSESQESPEEG